jgi:ABC-type sugar transport system substrate-binding protein
MVSAGLAVAFLAACGSSGSSASPVSTSSATAQSASADSAALAQAQQAVTVAEAAPTTIALPPLKTAPAKGKTFVFIQCTDTSQCALNVPPIREAASALGWNVKVLSATFANPATLVTALKQALQYKPVAVSFVGVPYAAWASVVPAYKAAHVALIPEYVGATPTTYPIVANFPTVSDYTALGKLMAQWFAVTTDGKGDLLYQDVPQVGSLAPILVAFKAELGTLCPACGVTVLSQTLADLSSSAGNSEIVSQLRTHPNIGYVFSQDGDWIHGLPSALAAAGLSRVKAFGVTPTAEQYADISSGSELAWFSQANLVSSWMAVDAAARVSEGMSLPSYTGVEPFQLIVKQNVGTLKTTVVYDPTFDYAAQFKTLWKA